MTNYQLLFLIEPAIVTKDKNYATSGKYMDKWERTTGENILFLYQNAYMDIMHNNDENDNSTFMIAT